MVIFMVIPVVQVFEDVRLGPLLGKGGNGRVYLGLWNLQEVAVKVKCDTIRLVQFRQQVTLFHKFCAIVCMSMSSIWELHLSPRQA